MKMHLLAALAIPLGIAGCVNPSVTKIKDSRALPSYAAPSPSQKPEIVQKDSDSYCILCIDRLCCWSHFLSIAHSRRTENNDRQKTGCGL